MSYAPRYHRARKFNLATGSVFDTLQGGYSTYICNTSQGLRGSRKFKHGALILYMGNRMRAVVEAIGSFDLVLPSTKGNDGLLSTREETRFCCSRMLSSLRLAFWVTARVSVGGHGTISNRVPPTRRKIVLGDLNEPLDYKCYLEKILKKFWMENFKKGYTPVIEKHDYKKSQAAKTSSEVQRIQRVPYASAIEAEYMAVAEASMEAVLMRKFIDWTGTLMPSRIKAYGMLCRQ
ncbi:hypothetical protein Tco_0666801 [Tanacetum coccineum]